MNWFQKKLTELKKTDGFKRESAKIEAEEAEWTFQSCPRCGHPFVAQDKHGLYC